MLRPTQYCRYLHFDFHHICGHVHFERLSILYEQISDFIEKNGYGFLHTQLGLDSCYTFMLLHGKDMSN